MLSQFGYHLIEITSRKGDKAKGRHILFPIEVAGAHRDQLDAQADSLERLGAERADRAALDTVARALRLPIGKAGAGAAGHQGPARATSSCRTPGVWAFQGGKPGATSPVIETSIRLLHLPARQPAAGGRAAARRRSGTRSARPLGSRRRSARPRALAQDYMKRLEAGSSMAEAAEAMKLPHKEFGPFTGSIRHSTTRSSWARRSGWTWDSGAACSTPRTGMYVIQVLEHTKADSAQFVKELDQLPRQA